MRRTMMAAALLGASLSSGETARAQEWGGAAGVAAMRGYTASPSIRMTSYDGGRASSVAPIPADAEAVVPSSTTTAASSTVTRVAVEVLRHRRPAVARFVQAGAKRRSHHRHPGAA